MAYRDSSVDYGFGQMGSIFTNVATEVVAPTDRVIVAIQFLDDTTFNSLSPEKGTTALNSICVGDAAGETGSGIQVAAGSSVTGAILNAGALGGQIINAGADDPITRFPKGLTIFGRWSAFSIDVPTSVGSSPAAAGGVIAYLGY